MSDLVIVAVVASVPSTLVAAVAAFSAWDGRKQAHVAAKGIEENKTQIARLEISFDGALTKLMAKTEEAAINAGIAAQMKIGAEEAARVAVATASKAAAVAVIAQDAAELRSPQTTHAEDVKAEVQQERDNRETKRVADATEQVARETKRLADAADPTAEKSKS